MDRDSSAVGAVCDRAYRKTGHLRVAGVAVVLFVAAALMAQSPSPGSIEGLVLKSGTTDPLQGVIVTATPETGAPKKSTSDADGKFAIRDLPAGRYVLSMARTGFAKPKRGSGPVNVSLGAGQSITGVKLQMAATAVITGRVLDENNNPFNGKTVYVVSPRYEMGRRMLNPNPPSSSTGLSARTNERGEYRLYGIEPGDQYYVVSSADLGQARFYPGVSDPADSVPLALSPGSETGGIDIRIAPIPLFVVRMKSTAPIDGIPVSSSSGILRSFSSLSNIQLNRRSRDGLEIHNVVPYGNSLGGNSDGTIESPGLPPGSYDLWISNATFNSGSSHIAFDIANHDVDLGALTALSVAPLTGTVRPISGLSFDAMRVTLTPLDGLDRSTGWNPNYARIAADGTFRFANSLAPQTAGDTGGTISDGIYQIGVSGLPSNMYVATARYGTRDALDEGLHIER